MLTKEIIYNTFDKGIADYCEKRGKEPDLIFVSNIVMDIITDCKSNNIENYMGIKIMSSIAIDVNMCLMLRNEDINLEPKFQIGYYDTMSLDCRYSIKVKMDNPTFFTQLRIQPTI